MRRRMVILLGLLMILSVLAPAASADSSNFNASLKGRNEVPPNDSKGAGEAIFKLSKDGSELRYKLIVANIDNVFASHIHCGAAGTNGPVGVTLFSGSPDSGAFNGILAQGTIAGPNAGNSCGWADLDAVVWAMENGAAYVNVHTNPGIPSGELRGQIK